MKTPTLRNFWHHCSVAPTAMHVQKKTHYIHQARGRNVLSDDGLYFRGKKRAFKNNSNDCVHPRWCYYEGG